MSVLNEMQLHLRIRLCGHAGRHVRYDCRPVTILLKREGWGLDAKSIYRLYNEENRSLWIAGWRLIIKALDHWAYRNSADLDFIRSRRRLRTAESRTSTAS